MHWTSLSISIPCDQNAWVFKFGDPGWLLNHGLCYWQNLTNRHGQTLKLSRFVATLICLNWGLGEPVFKNGWVGRIKMALRVLNFELMTIWPLFPSTTVDQHCLQPHSPGKDPPNGEAARWLMGASQKLETMQQLYPLGSMYGIFTCIYHHKIQPNVGKYTIHRSYGYCDNKLSEVAWISLAIHENLG